MPLGTLQHFTIEPSDPERTKTFKSKNVQGRGRVELPKHVRMQHRRAATLVRSVVVCFSFSRDTRVGIAL